ncbi:MAG: hypothetical protein FWC09_01475 [Lachnospiraceae bacterium]|nr:hypothetical protein [Lachnospiraceae bacterium]
MNFIRNIKLRGKLFGGFSIVLAFMLVLAAFGAFNILSVDAEYTYALEYPMERMEILNDFAI